MIDRLYLKNCLTFLELELEFEKSLIIFSGPSGAGKSILMEALLALFGLKETKAEVVEATISSRLGLDEIAIDEDEPNIFRLNRAKSVRYFINNQQISKKNLATFSSKFINYLTLKDLNEFENENLIKTLDEVAMQDDNSYRNLLNNFSTKYSEFQEKEKRLSALKDEEQKIEELKEFAKFEIKKIEDIDPKADEYETLLQQKKELSKKEKIQEAISEASNIFAYEHKVSEALQLLDEHVEIFDEAINELKVLFESANDRLDELDELDIETLLDRLDKLASLKNRHGSIEEALNYLETKRDELKGYENIKFELEQLDSELKELKDELISMAKEISKKRANTLKGFSAKVNSYLNSLYLSDLRFAIVEAELCHLGVDKIDVTLASTKIDKISSGELNRVRLSFLAAFSSFVQKDSGVLIVDEIDANLSGKESMSIAKVLEDLSKNYQIFAISHQPQLSSKAQSHYLVYKEDGISSVKLLSQDERIEELARMISGDNITQKAIDFAKSLLK